MKSIKQKKMKEKIQRAGISLISPELSPNGEPPSEVKHRALLHIFHSNL